VRNDPHHKFSYNSNNPYYPVETKLRKIKSIDKKSKQKLKDPLISNLNILSDSLTQYSYIQDNSEKNNLFLNNNFQEFLKPSSKNLKEALSSSDIYFSSKFSDKLGNKESPTDRFTLNNIVSDEKESVFLSSNPESGQKTEKNALPKLISVVRTPEPRKYYKSKHFNPISEAKPSKKENISLDRHAGSGFKKNMLKSRIEKKKKLLQQEENEQNELQNDPEIEKRIENLEQQLQSLKRKKKKRKQKRKSRGLTAFDQRLISTLVKSYKRERLFANSSSRYEFARKKNLIQKFEPNHEKEESKEEDNNPVLTVVNLINQFATKIMNN
jgi:hypothetical protein